MEVALSESEQHVLDKALRWLNACPNAHAAYGVPQVIVIKIEPTPRSDRNGGPINGTRSMKAWRYAPGAATTDNFAQFFEFGIPNPQGNGNGATAIGQMVLQIPTTSFYHPDHVPNDLGPNIDIDLYSIRLAIEACYDWGGGGGGCCGPGCCTGDPVEEIGWPEGLQTHFAFD